MNSDIAGTYAIFMGYWNNFFRELSPRTRMPELTGNEFEHLVYQLRKTTMPASESESPRKYNPSAREIQHGIDLTKKIISSSQNPKD